MRRWLAVSAVIFVFGQVMAAQTESETPKLERIDGKVTGVIVGLHRATISVVSSRQAVTYLHIPLNKVPEWLKTGLEITAFYRTNEDGSFWVEQITQGSPPVIAVLQPQTSFSAIHPSPTPQSHAPTPSQTTTSRQGTLTDLRQRQLASRGLSSAVQRSFPPLNISPIEMEVQRLLPHYKAATRFFNPKLTDEQAEAIASAILRSSLRNGVDPRLVVAVIACESSFRPDAVGKKGEIGLGQLMPSTAEAVGVDPYDPIQNIEGCVRYLRQQLDRFLTLELALAAYNAGPTTVSKVGGIPQNSITPRYIQKVTTLYRQLCGQ